MADDSLDLPGEIWKAVPGFSAYEVSNMGRTRSVDRARRRHRGRWGATNHEMRIRGAMLKPIERWSGDRKICLLISVRPEGGKARQIRVHRVVLEAFIGPCPAGMEGCHNDGDPFNNRLDNLRWDTKRANQEDSKRHGTKAIPPVHFGEGHHNARLTSEQVMAIRSLPVERGMFSRLGRQYGVSHQTIRRIINREARANDQSADCRES